MCWLLGWCLRGLGRLLRSEQAKHAPLHRRADKKSADAPELVRQRRADRPVGEFLADALGEQAEEALAAERGHADGRGQRPAEEAQADGERVLL